MSNSHSFRWRVAHSCSPSLHEHVLPLFLCWLAKSKGDAQCGRLEPPTPQLKTSTNTTLPAVSSAKHSANIIYNLCFSLYTYHSTIYFFSHQKYHFFSSLCSGTWVTIKWWVASFFFFFFFIFSPFLFLFFIFKYNVSNTFIFLFYKQIQINS